MTEGYVTWEDWEAKRRASRTPEEIAEEDRYAAIFKAQYDRAVWVVCPYGYCGIYVDPLDNKIISSLGPVGCPCDLTPGWKSRYVEGMGKPHPPVLAKGRKTNRVRRSQRRHQLPDWVTR